MTNLSHKVFEFKRYFNITADFAPEQEFSLDKEGDLLAKWQDNFHYLTNKRNPTKFLSKSTMQHKLKYKIDFLRALNLVPPKTIKPKKEPKIISLNEQNRLLESSIKFQKYPN